jgi:hypothetical protein
MKIRRFVYPLYPITMFGAAAVFAVCIHFSVAAFRQDRLNGAEREILAALEMCYAVEGTWSRNIDYLARNYFLNIDRGRFVYTYETGSDFSSETEPPSFSVTAR